MNNTDWVYELIFRFIENLICMTKFEIVSFQMFRWFNFGSQSEHQKLLFLQFYFILDFFTVISWATDVINSKSPEILL